MRLRWRPALLWRVHAFAVAIAAMTLLSIIAAPRLASNQLVERDAALVGDLLAELAHRHRAPADLAAAVDATPSLVERGVVLYGRDGAPISRREPPLPPLPPAQRELAPGTLRVEAASAVIALGPAAGGAIARVEAAFPQFPVLLVLVSLVSILVLTLVSAAWFARTIARPLAGLGAAARRLGRGELSVRVRSARADELGDVARAFDEMAEQLEGLLRNQRRMMADISHELRTPLTRVKLALELAVDDPGAARDALEEVAADLHEVEEIIEDIFALVRLDHERAQLTARPLALRDLVLRAAARFADHYPDRTLELDAGGAARGSPGAADAQIRADPVLLRRALDNLLDNAAKYSPPHTPITLRVGRAGPWWTIDVVDRGTGMSPEELARAFTPFWRADASRTRATGGVGLGLPLAQRVARAHGGDIHLTSARGEGTTARLQLPAGPAPALGAAARAATAAAGGAAIDPG